MAKDAAKYNDCIVGQEQHYTLRRRMAGATGDALWGVNCQMHQACLTMKPIYEAADGADATWPFDAERKDC